MVAELLPHIVPLRYPLPNILENAIHYSHLPTGYLFIIFSGFSNEQMMGVMIFHVWQCINAANKTDFFIQDLYISVFNIGRYEITRK
jgi:hypothetical protein